MPYAYRSDIALADIAFDAWGDTPEALFATALDALTGAMVEDPETVRPRVRRTVTLAADSLETLLFRFLDEAVYRKDADGLFLRAERVEIRETADGWTLAATLAGEKPNPERHMLSADVKAVTWHYFRLERTVRGWEATVVVDV